MAECFLGRGICKLLKTKETKSEQSAVNRPSAPRDNGEARRRNGTRPLIPLSKCVKAVDKGVRREIDGEATNKGVRRELTVNSLRFKARAANPELCGGMGKRSRWRAGDCMLPFVGREVEVCGRGDLRGVMPRPFQQGQP